MPGVRARDRLRRRRSCSGCARPCGGSSAEERAAAVGLLALPLAFGLHALVDYDLDFLAVAAPTALVAAALLGAGRPPRSRAAGVLVAVSAVVAAAVAVWVLAAPRSRAAPSTAPTVRPTRATSTRPPPPLGGRRASTRSRPIRSTPAPPWRRWRATIGRRERLYEQATRLQPENPDTWYQLGVFRQIALGDQCGAYFALNAAYTLDPRSSLFSPGSALDVARDAVNDPTTRPAVGSRDPDRG